MSMRHAAKTGFAKHLRREMTAAERALWYRLRDRRLLGFKFRRQFPIGPYIVDFVCLARALIVEIDGSQHLLPGADATRDAFLHREGFQVLRFWNNAVLASGDDVCDMIARGLLAARSPFPASVLRKIHPQGR
ncbi:endonuclease domain-containing protein [Xanthomonas arboricola pv. populi]|nr:endonuclease domain-containing protein [Xanthomonas arboricola pv. populi]